MNNNAQSVFLALLRAGLWDRSVDLEPYLPINYRSVIVLAEEQSVPGLIAAGFDNALHVDMPEKVHKYFSRKLAFIEKRNTMMNYFIGVTVDNLREKGISTLLLKGQGIARCYSQPEWRSAGDIDFLMDGDDYEKAKAFFDPLSSSVEAEGVSVKHLGFKIEPWVVELHGTLRCGLSNSVDRKLDAIQAQMFAQGRFCKVPSGSSDVCVPPPDVDVVYVFSHILQHFYRGGIGLRQICDWCRLLWENRGGLDVPLLESRLRSMRLLTEWRAFAAYAVEYLGMDAEAVPLYDGSPVWKRKARRIQSFIMKVGNFGQKRDMSYFGSKPYLVRKAISLGQRLGDLCRHALIFPMDSLRFFPAIVFNGLRSAMHGEG